MSEIYFPTLRHTETKLILKQSKGISLSNNYDNGDSEQGLSVQNIEFTHNITIFTGNIQNLENNTN